MHNAPSVSYPVGRCAFQRWLYAFFSVVTSAVLLAWGLSQGLTEACGVAFAAAAVGALSGWRALGQTAILSWDGQVWCLHDQSSGVADTLGEVRVALDFQKALLLHWQSSSDTLRVQPQWLWLGWHHSDNRWQDVRRAVYQRSNLG